MVILESIKFKIVRSHCKNSVLMKTPVGCANCISSGCCVGHIPLLVRACYQRDIVASNIIEKVLMCNSFTVISIYEQLVMDQSVFLFKHAIFFPHFVLARFFCKAVFMPDFLPWLWDWCFTSLQNIFLVARIFVVALSFWARSDETLDYILGCRFFCPCFCACVCEKSSS